MEIQADFRELPFGFFTHLPYETSLHIFSFVPKEYYQIFLCRVCKAWKEFFTYRRIFKYHVCESLIKIGDLGNLKKMIIPKTYGLCEFQNLAVKYGHFEILVYLCDNKLGKMIDKETVWLATKYNRFEILK